MVFRKKIVSAPETVVYKILSFLRHWQSLLKEYISKEVEQMSSRIMAMMRRLQGELEEGLGVG